MTGPGDNPRDLASLVGTVLDGTYRLDQLIGEGGMGAVFRGRHVLMKKDVAIKVLHPDFNRDPELVRRFDREAQSAARLSHPNCIQVTAYGTTGEGMRYLVMQLLEGVELADLLTTPIDVKRVVDWSIQILRGLEHAHEKGVIHRDLKPQNVFITRDHDGSQLLKLVDFGIAKLVGGEGADPLTRAGMVFGTPQYMSPEQALGQEIDARADLYAVGILMFQMLTGKLPFNHEDAIALIRMQVSNQPPALPDSVPQELAAIVYRLLAKQPDQRYPDAKTVRAALERYKSTLANKKMSESSDPLLDIVHGNPEITGVVPTGRPLPEALRPRQLTLTEGLIDTRRWSTRRWAGVVVAGLAAVLALGGGVWYFVVREPPAPPATPETKPEPAPETKQQEPAVEPVPETLAVVPGPSEQELKVIDDLIDGKKLDEAQAQIDALLERYPGHADLVRRDARQRSQRPGLHEAALRRYDEALRKDPDLARDPVFLAEVDAILRQPPVTDTAIDLATDLGKPGHAVLLGYVNDPKPWATFEQRTKIRAALAADPEAAAQIDVPLNRRRDLEQAAKAADPCQALKDALAAIQAEPLADYAPALKAVVPPAARPGETMTPTCSEAAALLATVRTDYAQRFPEAFAPAKKKRPAPKKKKKKR